MNISLKNRGKKKNSDMSMDGVNENSLNEESKIENSNSIEDGKKDMYKNKSNKKECEVVTDNMLGATELNADQINNIEYVNKEDIVKQEQNINENKFADETLIALDNIKNVVTVAEKRLNKDINDLHNVLANTIAQNINKILGETKNVIKADENKVEAFAQKIANDAVNRTIKQIKCNAQTNNEIIVSTVKAESRVSRENQEKATKKLSRIEESIKEWKEYDEEVCGRLSKVDELVQILSDKGITITQEFPPINSDEEDIVNLVRYSQKITEQLGFAARELIRKREAFESQKQRDVNEQKIIEQKVQEARDKGVDKGKYLVIKELLSPFDGIDGIKDSNNNYLKTIWNKLKDLDVEIDGDGYYEKGNNVELLDVDIEKMMAMYPGIEGAGRYKVVKTGLVFREEIIVKAEFKKIEESVEIKDDNSSENQKEKKCDARLENNIDVLNEDGKVENNIQ